MTTMPGLAAARKLDEAAQDRADRCMLVLGAADRNDPAALGILRQLGRTHYADHSSSSADQTLLIPATPGDATARALGGSAAAAIVVGLHQQGEARAGGRDRRRHRRAVGGLGAAAGGPSSPSLLEQGPIPNPRPPRYDRHRLIRLAHSRRRRPRHDHPRGLRRLGPAVGRSRPQPLCRDRHADDGARAAPTGR